MRSSCSRACPRAYDWMGAVLSFGQDPRWRATLVDQINPLPGQRVLDVATGTGLVAFALARRGVRGGRARPERGHARRRPAAHLDEHPDARSAASRSCRARPSGSRSTTASSTRSRSPTCSATSTTARRRCASSPAWSNPAAGSGWSSSACPVRLALRARCGACTPASGCRSSDAPCRRRGSRSAASSDRTSRSSTRRSPTSQRLWRESGIGDVEQRNMSFGAGLVMWGVRNGRGERAP